MSKNNSKFKGDTLRKYGDKECLGKYKGSYTDDYIKAVNINTIMPPQTMNVKSRSLDTVSQWALSITLVAALFVFIPSVSVPLATTKTFFLAAGALISLALYILARLGRGNVIFPPKVLIGILWLPVLAYLLSSVFSGVPFLNALWGTALEPDTLGFMLVAAFLGTLTALIFRRPDHYATFLKVGGYALGVFVAVQVLIILAGQFTSKISPALSLAGSYSDLATLAGLGVISILITLRFIEVSQKTSRLLLVVGALSLFLLAVANVQLTWILLALVSLGFFVEAVMRRGKSGDADLDEAVIMDESPVETEEGSHSLVLPLVVLAVSLFFLLGGQLGGALANALNINVLNVRPSWPTTVAVGQQVYSSSPVFGSGPNTFGVEWLKHRDTALNSTVFWNLDFSSGIGFIPTSFVSLGLVGALAWLGFLGLLLVLGARMLILRTPQDPYVRYIAILSFLGSIYLFAIAIFDLPNTIVLALAFVFAGLLVSTTRYAAGSQQWGVIFSRSPRLGFVIVFGLTLLLLASVVAAYSLVGRYVATYQFAKAASELSGGNLDAADQAVTNAVSFAPTAVAYQLQASIANARLNQIAGSSTMERTAAQNAYQAALSAGINAALTATNLDPSDYRSWLALGNLYAQAVPLGVEGSYDSAKTAFVKAQELNPTNPQIPYILAQLNIANNDLVAAKEELKKTIALKQDYTPAIFLLSQLEVQTGNVREALTAALAANYFTPNNPSILFQIGILYAAQNDLKNAAAALSAAVGANPQFANARYFLAAVFAKQGNYAAAVEQVEAIAAMSEENATAVATQLSALRSGKNPFPANLLTLPSNTVTP
jgi:tetratricopeptide (TPR) repeat protein